MPTMSPQGALSLDEAQARAGQRAFASMTPQTRIGGVGLEPEFFPVHVGAAGKPAGRVLLRDGSRGIMERIDAIAAGTGRINRRHAPSCGPWEFALAQGGRITFEPGAQVEHSTAVRSSAAEALSDVQTVANLLHRHLAPQGIVLAAMGLDPWADLESVPQQLNAGRYTSQAAYYDRRGPWGAVMMRQTASLQVNLDLGSEGVWQERWLLANLVSPLITATFACSPSAEAVCERARVWQRLDPTRTGFSRLLVESEEMDPRLHWADSALNADVMLFRLGRDDFEVGEPGFSFASWVDEGHPRVGWPTLDDLDYHLTTLFFEVRPRGFFELRAGEALPDRWRAVPVVLISALFYEDRARQQVLSDLIDWRHRLPEIWQRAAIAGVRDPEIGGRASRVWKLALDAAHRMPAGYFCEHSLEVAREYLIRFVLRGRMPADDLAKMLAEDPARALSWASSGWSQRAGARV